MRLSGSVLAGLLAACPAGDLGDAAAAPTEALLTMAAGSEAGQATCLSLGWEWDASRGACVALLAEGRVGPQGPQGVPGPAGDPGSSLLADGSVTARSLAERMADVLNIKDFGAHAVGEPGFAAFDSTPALQAALDAARGAGGGLVYVPSGTYLVTAGGTGDYLRIYGNTTLAGDGASSTLRVMDGTGPYRRLIGAGPTPASAVTNVLVSSLRIDQNVAGAADVSLADGQQGMAIELLGGGNVTIDGVAFDQTAGVNTVSLNGPALTNVRITNCRFRFVAKTRPAGYDNSAVYVEATNAVVSGNILESTVADGALGGVELHAGRAVFTGNRSSGYDNLVRIVTPAAGPGLPSNDVAVVGNSATAAGHGIDLWALAGHTLRNVVVSGNVLQVANAERGAGTTAQSYWGIAFYPGVGITGDFAGVLVAGNTVQLQREPLRRPSGEALSGGIMVMPFGSLVDVVVERNVIRDAPLHGLRVQAGGAATSVMIRDNLIVDAGHSTSSPYRMAIGLFGIARDCRVERNHLKDTGAAMLGLRGLWIAPSATSAGNVVRDNTRWTVSGAPFLELVDARTSDPQGVEVYLVPGAVGPAQADTQTVELRAPTAGVWTVAAPRFPTQGARITFRVRNVGAGAMGAVTWGSGLRVADWTNPAPGHSRSVTLEHDGVAWIELSRTPADVPND